MFKYIIEAMAFSRTKWIERVRDAQLSGALGEYTKLLIARDIKYPDYWSYEVLRLLKKISFYMDKKRVQTSGFNRIKALKEAIKEASIDQGQITKAKNKMTDMKNLTDKQFDKILKTDLDSEDVMKQMLEEFAEQTGLDVFLK